MEPQIRYAHSADGASIATRTLGAPGRRPDVVVVPSALMVVTTPASLAAPEIRAGLERLAESRRVILFDARGTGLSDRDVADFSPAAWLADIQAVIDQAADGHADLIAARSSSPMAIAYAAAHPGQVRRLILVEPISHAGESDHTAGLQALSAMVEIDFERYLRHAALEVFGWTETGRRVAAGLKGTVSRDVWRASDGARRELDVRDLLPALSCPTLVLQYTAMDQGARDAPRRIASRIPGARLATIHSATPLLFAFDPEGDASLVLNFLD
jgi:pimeloyl-ACP methyl ester carboxylesterase